MPGCYWWHFASVSISAGSGMGDSIEHCGDGNKCSGSGWVRGCKYNPVQNSSLQYTVNATRDMTILYAKWERILHDRVHEYIRKSTFCRQLCSENTAAGIVLAYIYHKCHSVKSRQKRKKSTQLRQVKQKYSTVRLHASSVHRHHRWMFRNDNIIKHMKCSISPTYSIDEN